MVDSSQLKGQVISLVLEAVLILRRCQRWRPCRSAVPTDYAYSSSCYASATRLRACSLQRRYLYAYNVWTQNDIAWVGVGGGSGNNCCV